MASPTTQRLIIGILSTIIGGLILAFLVSEVRINRATARDVNLLKSEVSGLRSTVNDLQYRQYNPPK